MSITRSVSRSARSSKRMDGNNTGWKKTSGRILEHATSLNNYNRWLIGNFKPYLRGALLEVGAGLGGLSVLLPQKNLTLSDNNEKYFEYLKEKTKARTLLLDIEKATPDKLAGHFDAILSSNVFEHIKDDQKAFNNCFKLLRQGGYLCLFVPAGPQIYGQLDEDMGHFRRYTKAEVELKAKKAGFIITKLTYANLPGFFTWWGRGRLIKSSSSDSFLAKVFDTLITPLLFIEKYFDPPFGQSVLLVARKI